MNHLPIVTTIKQVYPGIDDELCNRHSVSLTRIKHKFQHLYHKCEPTAYVISKGLCVFTQKSTKSSKQQPACSSFMAIQNGIIISLAKTATKQNIYINYNKWQLESQILSHTNQNSIQTKQQLQQQLILTYKGQIQSMPNISKQVEELAKILAQVYGLAVEDLSLGKIVGGILYIDGKLEEGCFYEREALVWAFYIAILELNGLRQQYSLSDIQTTLLKYYQATHKNTQNLLIYANIVHCQHNIISISNKNYQMARGSKFVICKLPNYNKFKKNKENQLFKKLRFFQDQQIEIADFDEGMFVEGICEQLKQYCLDLLKVCSEQEQLIKFMLRYVGNSIGFVLTQHTQYIAILTSNHRIPDTIAKLTKQLKPSLPFPPTNTADILENQSRKYHKNLSAKIVDQYVFSTLGCTGISVLDPRGQIWYCQ